MQLLAVIFLVVITDAEGILSIGTLTGEVLTEVDIAEW